MNTGIKGIVRKALQVVSPPADAPAPLQPPKHTQARSEAPVLGHVPGVDKREYGSRDHPACLDERNYTHVVDGRAYRLFFFCGHPRSGTHWMDAVLKLHPKIWIDGEYRLESLHNSLNDLTGKGWHACYREPMRSAAIQAFHRSVREIVGSSWSMRPDAQWLGDRTPRVVRAFLPGAPHFLIIRDPRDVVVSWAHQEIKNAAFNYTEGGFDAHYSTHRQQFLVDPGYFNRNPELLLSCEPFVRRLVARWRNHLRHDLQCLKKMDAGEASGGIAGGPARCLVVRYENIHQDPEGERQRLYQFLGLDGALAAPLSEETRTKPKLAVENPHAVLRKGEVGDWKTFFTDDAKRWFKETGNDTLIELGYASDDRW